jgi:hypothetical protein
VNVDIEGWERKHLPACALPEPLDINHSFHSSACESHLLLTCLLLKSCCKPSPLQTLVNFHPATSYVYSLPYPLSMAFSVQLAAWCKTCDKVGKQKLLCS